MAANSAYWITFSCSFATIVSRGGDPGDFINKLNGGESERKVHTKHGWAFSNFSSILLRFLAETHPPPKALGPWPIIQALFCGPRS